MSTDDSSTDSLLEAFIYETSSLLDQLDEIMLDSEKQKSLSEDNINEIFRIMHTTKGSAAMMGFNEISNLAHSVEDVFFLIREDPSRLNLVFDTLFDLIFQSSDFLRQEIESIQNNGSDYSPSDPTDLINKLEAQAAVMKGQAPEKAKSPDSEKPDAPEAAAKPEGDKKEAVPPEDTTQIRVFFADDSQMENIRAFMLMTQLKDHCDFIDSDPPHPETDSSLCDSIIKNGFIITVKPSYSLDDVIKVIEASSSIKSYEVLGSSSGNTKKEEKAAAASAGKPAAPAASSAKKAKKPGSSSGHGALQSLISVNQSKLDHLMDLVGELVTAESMVASNKDLAGLKLDNFTKSFRELRKLTDELQDVVMSIRMVPLTGNFQKMNRIVRDMSKKLNKKVDLVTIGGETEVDKTISDALTDPLMHMIRNSMDHAIETPEERVALGKPETGKITLSARNVGGEILIDVKDDGRGLDTDGIMAKAKKNDILTKPESEYTEKEIFHLIMLPGFSTNDNVTEYSGRGVGMDVVRKNVENVGGNISIHSEKNKGTTFTMKIPLTLAIMDVMDISLGKTTFSIPITSIKQSFKLTDDSKIMHNTDGSDMIMLRGECYPIIRLYEYFNIPTQVTDLKDGIVIQVESGSDVACIFADELLGEQQVVVKPFPPFFNKYNLKNSGLSGCTILGNGSISLILDIRNLLSSER
ncbi:MAG TPA: chemotaxis protein CheA [Ruminococcaceae bacterium]|jgi:two-component system chemotaxis sensor kinase CheA|nr:chemotaxis protein CheA [Oscillospiraceae bacterium]HCM24059.1 chemotaxis protein CheA [Oscillospiraceae bacterium]